MKKLGIDCRLWNQTGVGRYIRNLVANLAKIDTENTYILFFRKEEFDTVPLPGKNFQKRLADIQWHTFVEQTQFKKILEKEKLDLVHFPYFSYPIGYKGKFIITIHDLIIDHFPTGKASTLPSIVYWTKQLAYKFILQKAIKNAEKIITVSGATKQEIIDHYHAEPEKIVVTYEGIDKNISPESQEKIDVKMPYFLNVGNSYPHKNLERLVDAFQLFLAGNNKAYLIFVGKEDYFSKRLEQYVLDKNLSEHISFYRNVSDSELSFLYHHAKALVAASLMEGFGLPVAEAMSNNCLVLASDIPSFVEICADAAVYFDPYNTKDIAEKLSLAIEGKIDTISQKKKIGLARVKEFSWKKMSEQTKELYNKS